ncbi:glycoside hydrolase family 2 TIM barrel-domain containing protein [Aureibaculum sp. 2210JD6-5]|uniref:glycoside hydrolase family 2 TIM barrel-domain containing protein n=1 Tax=Aureibaculum sp. 2210JD6-5 TaxID=3103957 RepID=UPI002AAD9CF0|nr:glycoside hydrolase family 2 TIM barrel-domain containing protein [Aureibaculum sp. 2210JD6-5]MDY7395808.1 glycoside hydrolase family 2 TIM barrel-domain containing protein [Aureibaculum sp. 2210JD6-5]
MTKNLKRNRLRESIGYTLSILLLILIMSCKSDHQDVLDLSGKWTVTLGENLEEKLNTLSWDKKEGEIQLPGSLQENGFGLKTVGSDFGVLTPTHKFIGIASYKKDIVIPENWKNKKVELFLDRVLWESKVFIDGKEISVQDALGTPHIHKLGQLSPGKHTLEVRVNNDMIHNIGDKGHAYGEYTQSIWNGIVGKIELQAKDPTHITNVRTFSDIEKDELKIELEIEANENETAEIIFEISELNGGKAIEEKVTFDVTKGINKKETTLKLSGKLKKWSEFKPTVYNLSTTVKTEKYSNTKETEFGFLKISQNGTNILINNTPVFLRGNLDCVHFPLTGYASATIEDWEKIFRTYKDYGLNHVRFHSWCPPEAAFKAANRIGIYIQAEASIWIDWWMSEDMVIKGRPEMDTKGHPKGLGKDPKRDEFVIEEMNRVVDYYGNHPSFTMFCIGNELGNSDFDVTKHWVDDLKKKDPRRLYAISTARKITEVDDYSATHYIPGIGGARGLRGPGTDWDFEETYSKSNIPIIAHEIGQWPVYPAWKEIEKYTGVLKARNLEEMKALADENGVGDQDVDFQKASGALNQLMYKYETESFLRTKSCAGVQLLSIQDYQGQGEALIGWLDAHWESKGITTPEKFREHFNETVPLLRVKKFVWKNDEVLEAKAQLSHYGNEAIEKGTITGEITTDSGDVLFSKEWPIENISIGSLTDISTFKFPLNEIQKAQRLKISLQLKNTEFKNEWHVWVYPSKIAIPKTDVLIANKLDENTLQTLNKGGKVLLVANNLGTEATSSSVNFYPLYWSLTFFPGQGKTSLGLLLKDKHKAFESFPTEFHSDWQWEPFGKSTKAFILNDMPKEYKPIAQVVDDFHLSNKKGVIFELKVGEGKLLVSGFDIENNDTPGANQLKHSLLNYMNSEEFNPEQSVEETYLKNIFSSIPKAVQVSNEEGFENAILNVNAAKNLKSLETNTPWTKNLDEVVVAKGTSYKVTANGTWKDANVSAWHGQNMNVEITCPNGILGTFYVQFNDWNNKGREGILEFEGRKVTLEKHSGNEGKWVKFHVMREDSNDGQLKFKANTSKGGNLMISKIVLVKE